MYSTSDLHLNRIYLVAALAGLLAVGCGSSGADEALNKSLKDAGQTRNTVYPFAGKVTIDRDPPKLERGYWLVVVLNDPEKLDTPILNKPHVEANQSGEFKFTTYGESDGIKPGKYIVTFGVYKSQRNAGYIPPDKLHNLYNDPDENAKNPEFVIDHKAPGKKDYEFNLMVKGKEPVTEPGPHALINGVMDERVPAARRAARAARKN
jgi:hypothetical protein